MHETMNVNRANSTYQLLLVVVCHSERKKIQNIYFKIPKMGSSSNNPTPFLNEVIAKGAFLLKVHTSIYAVAQMKAGTIQFVVCVHKKRNIPDHCMYIHVQG